MDSNSDGSFVSVQEKGRKRVRDVTNWRKSVAKRERYSSQGPPVMPDCGHNKKLQCMSLTKIDVHHFHKMFYSVPIKSFQDHLIIKYTQVTAPKRHRKKLEHSSSIGMTIIYYVKKGTLRPGTPDKLQVCQKTFMKIFNLKKTRIQNVCRRHAQGKSLKDKRGGDTRSKKFSSKREAIAKFMNQIRVVEKHYCRGRSSRQYLSSELNINKLWRLYNASCENEDVGLKVKKSFFRNHINLNFNIGFGAPAVDVCSQCLQFKEKLRHVKNNSEKNTVMSQKRVHSLRAKAFFELLGKDVSENTLVLSYDCQKNQVLPKVPDQKAYYSRQLYNYNFTIVEGSSKDKLSKENVFSYTWCEHQHSKGSNEIASCVFHALNSRVPLRPEINTVRLFADGCGGQNKNSILIGMVSKWLIDHAPPTVFRVELIFPVTGHSFMPSDRVFAYFEKEIRKKDIIILPQEYMDIYSNHATVIKLGSDCPVLNWKHAVEEVLKPPGQWHFKFNASKRFIISRNKAKTNALVRGEIFYKSDVTKPNSVTKKNVVVSDIHPSAVEKQSTVKEAKLKDIDSLLKSHYGEDWKQIDELSFYNEVLNNPCTATIAQADINYCVHTEDFFENNELRV